MRRGAAMTISKSYRLSDLIGDRAGLEHRWAAIEGFTTAFPPAVRFEFRNDQLVRHTRRLDARIVTVPQGVETLSRLADQIDAAHDLGLIHGDIREKNILQSDEDVHLIDWEPALRQVIGGVARWMVTSPCRHPDDRAALTVTRLTDLMGLALLNPAITTTQAASLASRALKAQKRVCARDLVDYLAAADG
jgi:hypothetical protein